jgi:hypothetical protein
MREESMTKENQGRRPSLRRGPTGTVLGILLLGLGGCAAAVPGLPEPRSLVSHSGARIRPDVERLEVINEWVTREQTNITDDPSFWVIDVLSTDEVYPWEGMELSNDTVRVRVDPRAGDARLVHQIYGHLHLMVEMGRQDEWLPEAPDAVGYDLERAILQRTADAWLLGRTVFDTAPYGPLDELMYANEAGYLDAFIFTARPEEFAAARTRWARENPGESDRYRNWFLETFNREPPGLRTS